MALTVANNIDEFNEQARAFAARAKEAGTSNTAIANTIKFMFGMYQEKQSEVTDQPDENWQYRDKDGDGIDDVMFNSKTGEEKPIDYGYGNDAFSELDSGDYAADQPTQTDIPRTALTAPGESGYNAGRSTESGEQVWSTSELERLENEQDFSSPMSVATSPQPMTASDTSVLKTGISSQIPTSPLNQLNSSLDNKL